MGSVVLFKQPYKALTKMPTKKQLNQIQESDFEYGLTTGLSQTKNYKMESKTPLEEAAEIFDNNTDCYADTWIPSDSDLVNGKSLREEGEVVPAMTKEKFIELWQQAYKQPKKDRNSYKCEKHPEYLKNVCPKCSNIK